MALTKIKTGSIADNAITDAKVADNITAGTAATLATARNIGGVSFNGSSAINLPGVNTAGSQDTTGNAATATVLATARNINGVSFNGSSAITVTAAAGTLTGATLASGVTASSLTSVGTLTGLTVQGSDYTTLSIQSGTTSHGAILNLGSSDDIDYGSITQFASGAGEGGRMRFKAGTTEVLNLYSNGNATFAGDIGVGGNTLNSWNSLHSAIQLGYGAVAVRQNNNTTYLTNNIYYEDSGSANPTYMHENEASALMCSDGNMLFFNAPSGTGTATLTERLRVDTEGNVGIGSGSNTNSHIVRGFSANKGLVIETQQPAIQLVDSDNNSRYFTIAYEQGAKTAYIHNQSNGPIRFDTNGVERFNIEGGGKLQSTSGIYFTGTGLDGTNTGIASSGDGGDLRVYISGNQNYTFSGHTLTIDSQGNGTPAQLTCKNNGSSGWTGAAVNLFYEGSSGNRGQGIYMHSQATDTEWYAGTMYAVDNARYSICYESTASFTEATAAAAHEIFYIGTSGQVWSGGGYNNTHTTSMNHALASYTNELNIMNSWSSGQNTVHFNYRSGNTHTDFSFYNGSSGGHPDLNAASFDTTSDYRMKKSVVNFTDNVCNKIKLLRPITYNWKANTKMNPAKQIGFLAHELQEQLPLAVKGEKDAMSEKDNTKIAPQTIKSEALSSYMMKALQEIITRLEALENA